MSLFGMYDPVSDRILNCKPGTLTYAHELGHKQIAKAGIGIQASSWFVYFTSFAVFALAFDMIGVARIAITIGLSFLVAEEIQAWIFAVKYKYFSPVVMR